MLLNCPADPRPTYFVMIMDLLHSGPLFISISRKKGVETGVRWSFENAEFIDENRRGDGVCSISLFYAAVTTRRFANSQQKSFLFDNQLENAGKCLQKHNLIQEKLTMTVQSQLSKYIHKP